MDKFAVSKGTSAADIKARSINLEEFTWSKDSAVAKKPEAVIKLRCKLLIGLVKSWCTLQKISNMDDKHIEGSIANTLFVNKFLVPPSVLSQIVDRAIDQISSSHASSV